MKNLCINNLSGENTDPICKGYIFSSHTLQLFFNTSGKLGEVVLTILMDIVSISFTIFFFISLVLIVWV